MRRIYESLLKEHLSQNRQMSFLTGPRQVGKTTTARGIRDDHHYFNWDRQADRMIITRGADAIAEKIEYPVLSEKKHCIVFDELHKYSKWKNFLKGFFDVYGEHCQIIVTGSSRLNIYRRGGDSLMGRYFPYRMHPVSVAEILANDLTEQEIRKPKKLDKEIFQQLLNFGGFPEPFLKASKRFYNRWHRLRTEQLFREDLRDLTRIQEVGQIQVLAELMENLSGQLANYSTLSRAVNVSVDTIRRWIKTLESLYHCFTIRPWYRNVSKSLRKQPKLYLRDWSCLSDPGAKYETFVGMHLLKAVEWWTDIGLGSYDLYYLRDKMKREVDFLVAKNNIPWFLVEVKSSSKTRISPSLQYFQNQLKAEHAFQVVFDREYVDRDCFSVRKPIIVPVQTFLSQFI